MPLNVRAAVVHGPNQPFVIEEVQLEGPRAGEVLMQVKTTGLCHSDLHAYEGKVPWQFPAILGHEAAGIVVECGPGVTQFKPGDHVSGCAFRSYAEYDVADARTFLAAGGLDVDRLAGEMDGKVASAFIRARKPIQAACCSDGCCA